jgi:uncharacterized protein (DUF2384 family)
VSFAAKTLHARSRHRRTLVEGKGKRVARWVEVVVEAEVVGVVELGVRVKVK